MRLKPYDRFQAIRRNSEYKRDWERLQSNPSFEGELERKWRLNLLYPPGSERIEWIDLYKKECGRYPGHDFFFDGPVKVIPHRKEQFYITTENGRIVIAEEDISRDEVTGGAKPTPVHIDYTPHLREGRYLTLEVDLTAREYELIEVGRGFIEPYRLHVTARVKKGKTFTPKLKRNILTVQLDLASQRDPLRRFKKLVRQYRNGVKRPTARERETTLDPWEVYDMHKKGKRLLSIAKEKYRFRNNPAYDNKAMSYYKQVERAYKKAEKMIEAVRLQRKQRK